MTSATGGRVACRIDSVHARAYRIPTETQPESDGTFEWSATTLVVVEIGAGGEHGLGYTYGDASIAHLVNGTLADVVRGCDALATAECDAALYEKIRNDGRCGLTVMAISAIDIALWDLKGKVLGVPVCTLLGAARERVPVYGSGGFTSYTPRELSEHMARWVHAMGIPRAKMKIGREPERDPERVAVARKAIGRDAQLFVDANGAYGVKEALAMADRLAEENVCWYEEPVWHRDLPGNAAVRARAPAIMEISNGEYGYTRDDFLAIVRERAADVVQADVTRCGGISGFLAVDALCDAYDMPFSSHCAPYATLHAAMAAKRLRHAEYFFDHVRIERMLFDGTPAPEDGALEPDRSRPGIGLELKRTDAEAFAV